MMFHNNVLAKLLGDKDMEKRKIVIVTRNMMGGGSERVIAQLADYFVTHEKDCTIVTINEGEVFYQLDSRIKLTPVGKKHGNKLLDKWKRYREVRRIVKREQPELVLSLPEEIGIYVLLALLGTGIPVYVSERNNPWVMPDVKLTRILRRLTYPFAKGIIFQTEMAKSFFPKYIQKKSVVLPNPVDSSRIPQPYEGEREKVIVGAGRLFEQKNFPLLIRAFSLFASNHPEYILRIYGEGYMLEELQRLVHQLKLTGCVEFPGKTQKLLEQMNPCAMFVLSSDYEGMPNVLLEAMCMGMPVISTNCPSGGPRELIEDGVNGLLVPVGDVTAMYQAMESCQRAETNAILSQNAYLIRHKLTDPSVFARWHSYLWGECKIIHKTPD